MLGGLEYFIHWQQQLARTILPHASSTGWFKTMQQIEQESWEIRDFDSYCGTSSSAGRKDSGAVSWMCFRIDLTISPEYLPPHLVFRFCPPPFARRTKFWHTYVHCVELKLRYSSSYCYFPYHTIITVLFPLKYLCWVFVWYAIFRGFSWPSIAEVAKPRGMNDVDVFTDINSKPGIKLSTVITATVSWCWPSLTF